MFQRKNKESPLHAAARCGNVDSMERLLSELSDRPLIDAHNAHGRTALMEASCTQTSDQALSEGYSHLRVAEILLEARADLEARGTASSLCKKCEGGKRKAECADCFKSWTPLMHAARQGRAEMVKCLMLHGADDEKTDTCRRTAAVLAKLNPDPISRDQVEIALRNYPRQKYQNNDEYRGNVNIAMVGERSVGKSSLINALRGSADASVDDVDCTQQVAQYPFHNKAHGQGYGLVFWDVPEGTKPMSTEHKYFRYIGARYFDVVVLIFDGDIKKSMETLIDHLAAFDIPCFLIRNKIDILLRGKASETFEETLQYVRDNLKTKIKRHGYAQETKHLKLLLGAPYFVSTKETDKFDFAQFERDLYAVSQARGFKFASDSVKVDPLACIAAVKIDGQALQYAAQTIRADPEVCTAAVQQDYRALQYTADSIKANLKVCLAAVQEDYRALQYAASSIRADPLVCRAALSQNRQAAKFMPKHAYNRTLADVTNDRALALTLVKHDARWLRDVGQRFQNDQEIVLAAVTQRGQAQTVRFASPELRLDPVVIKAAQMSSGGICEVPGGLDAGHIAAASAGSGDAYVHALADKERIVKVDWYKVPLEGIAGRLGIRHSFLAFYFKDSEEPVYVMEKAVEPEGLTGFAADQFKNGVRVSFWDDVKQSSQSMVCSSNCDPKFRMLDVHAVALATGPYEVTKSNCHDMAQVVFNICKVGASMEGCLTSEGMFEQAALREHIADIQKQTNVVRVKPNMFHVQVGRFLEACGVDVTRSRGMPSGSPMGVSQSTGSRCDLRSFESPIEIQSAINITKKNSMRSWISDIDVFRDAVHAHASWPVFRSLASILSDYALCGVEGAKIGCIVALGIPNQIFSHGGLTSPVDRFRTRNSRVSLKSLESSDALRRAMNASGILVIDGSTGDACAESFALQGPKVEETQAQTARRVARTCGCIVMSVEKDSTGELHIFAVDQPFIYCRPLNDPRVRDPFKHGNAPQFHGDLLVPDGWVATVPFLKEVRQLENVDESVYLAACKLGSEYAVHGVPAKGGQKTGCRVALGDFENLLSEYGSVAEPNPFNGDPSDDGFHGASLSNEGAELVRRYMNDDGFIVIDGLDPGYARAAGFKVENVYPEAYLARKAKCVVLKISQDSCGQIDIYVGDRKTTYCKLLSSIQAESPAEHPSAPKEDDSARCADASNPEVDELSEQQRHKQKEAEKNANKKWLNSLVERILLDSEEISLDSEAAVSKTGASGDVYVGTWKSCRGGAPVEKKVAIKSFRQAEVEDVMHEFTMGYMLRHPNIVSTFGICNPIKGLRDAGLKLVMEYAQGGNLHEAIFPAERDLREEARQRWLDNVVDAMCFIHGHGIVHNDLKSQNVLLTSRDTTESIAQVCDLGLSRVSQSCMSHADQGRGGGGTPAYRAPETYGGPARRASDVYSFAMLFYEANARKSVCKKDESEWDPRGATFPWEVINSSKYGGDLDAWIKAKPLDQRRPNLAHIPDDKKNMLRSWWQDKHEQRPSFMEIKKKLANQETTRPSHKEITPDELTKAIRLDFELKYSEESFCDEHDGVLCRWLILPTSEQTHEVLFIWTGDDAYLFVTQLPESLVFRIVLDAKDDLKPKSWCMWRIGPSFDRLYGKQTNDMDKLGLMEVHNLSRSVRFPDCLWISVQSANKLMLLEACKPFNERGEPCAVINLPDTADAEEPTWIGGPHCVRETEDGRLLTTQKGSDPSTTRSMFRERIKDMSKFCKCCEKDFLDTNAKEIAKLLKKPRKMYHNMEETWAIVETKLPEYIYENFNNLNHRVVPSLRSPPMLDYFKDGVAIASQDQQLSYLVVRHEWGHSAQAPIPVCTPSEKNTINIQDQMPTNPTAVGVVASPDRQCIFLALLGHDASLCRVGQANPEHGVVHHFATAPQLRFIHLAFDLERTHGFRAYALSSSLLAAGKSEKIDDAIFVMQFSSGSYDEITQIAILPLGISCKAHRVICESVKGKSYLFVTAFSKNQVRQFSNLDKIKMTPVSRTRVNETQFSYEIIGKNRS